VIISWNGYKAHKKQPETAQKVDLKLRDGNPDRNESKSSSSCGGKSVETGREVGWTWPNVVCHSCACSPVIMYVGQIK